MRCFAWFDTICTIQKSVKNVHGEVLYILIYRIAQSITYGLSLRVRLKEFYGKWWQSHSSNFRTRAPKNENLNPIQDGLFRGCSRMGGQKGPLLPKICNTYPTMMKLGTLMPYPKKIQKKFESCDAHFEFCWHQHFFPGNQKILLYQEIERYRLYFDI